MRQGQLRAQGLQTDRTNPRRRAQSQIKVVDDTLDKHFWFFDSKDSLLDAKNKKHAEIDADVNARVSQAEKAAGTGLGSAAGWDPRKGVLSQPGQGQGSNPAPEGTVIQGPSGKLVKKGGQWQPQ